MITVAPLFRVLTFKRVNIHVFKVKSGCAKKQQNPEDN